MKNLFLIVLSIFLSVGANAKRDKIKVLIVDGYSNHDWRYTTEVIQTMLLNSGFTEADVPPAALQTVLVYADDDKDAWNTMELICEGMKIRTFINGKRVADYNASGILDDKLHLERKVGTSVKIALQLHSSDELLIKFKDITIRTL